METTGPGNLPGGGAAMQLRIAYYGDTDTLSLWNGAPASAADDVADNLIVDYDAEGDAVGFTLDHAAELLLPLLTAAKQSAPEGKSGPAAPVKNAAAPSLPPEMPAAGR